MILLFARHVQVASKLSGMVVMEESFDSRIGNMHGITVDDTFKTVWIHQNRHILEVVIADENRNVWKLISQQGCGEQR